MKIQFRHSKLDLEPKTTKGQSSVYSGAAAPLTKSALPCGKSASALEICWIPNQVWNDGKGRYL
jgi:hypothetical protein